MSRDPRARRPARTLAWTIALAIAWIALGVGAAFGQEELTYSVVFEARIVPTERAAHVKVRVTDPGHHLREVRWRIDPERHRQFAADGQFEVEGDSVRWIPSKGAATFRYVFRIDHLRNERSYDARCAESWAIFRGDDLVPPARVRTTTGATSISTLRLRTPDGWSAVAPYDRNGDGTFDIDNPHRGFDRPTGWLLVGRLGVVRETVAGSRLAVGGPVGQHLRRLDILALLRWTLPSLREMLGELPPRLLVVGAGDPMWRGGLSGPRSAFVHASRPLITSDGTSPVLHELVHSVLGLEPGPGGDWIIEGLAEYYALEALVRSRTLSRRRHTKAMARLEERGNTAPKLEVADSTGAVSARAVGVLTALDSEVRKLTEDQRGLDDVVRLLMESRARVTTAKLRAAAETVSGSDLAAFFRRRAGS